MDIFFGITAASLPVLNAAIPKSWPSPANGIPIHDMFPALGLVDERASMKSDSRDEIHEDGRYLGQFEMKAYRDETHPADRKESEVAPSSAQTREWVDPAQAVQFPVPTHRDRLSHSGGVGDLSV